EAIDVSGGTPERRELSLVERQRIWANNELRPEQGGKIQKAILDYVISQNLNGADESLIEEFITTPNDSVKIALGKRIFRIAAEVAVEPIAQKYQEAWESGLLPRQDVRSASSVLVDIHQARAVPKDPKRFIARHVGRNQHTMRRTLNRLRDNLEESYVTGRAA
ncbi:MAG TPA: hypothetical protein VG964_03790, partial [Candidatus Saccharimonadales bacterium]|nr:hypothetical protein [Candidatus Saccharimonadales bacterium]